MELPPDKPEPVPGPLGAASDDDKLWALLAHLSFLVGAAVLAPLVIWLVKKDKSAFVDDQAKEALNFQLTVLIACLITGVSCILSPLIVVVLIGQIVYGILAAMEAYRGNRYRYPYTFRLIQ
jgi:hypothetical protein